MQGSLLDRSVAGRSVAGRSLQLVIALLLLASAAGACVAPVAGTPAPPAAEASAGSAETVTISHALGDTVVPRNPATVVVFDYSALDTLDQLGIPVVAVPQETLPPFLEKYRGEGIENAGSLFEPDYEKINQLQPDLIIAGERTAAVYAELSELAPTIVVTVDRANLLESYKAQITNLGVIFGKEAVVAERLAAIDAAVTAVQEAAAASGKNALIVMTSGGAVTAFGPGSRFGMIHDLLGVTPVVEDIEAATHGDAISFEFILEHNPDILFVIDRDTAIGQGTEAAEAVLDNDLMRQTKAWMNDDIVYLDGTRWYLANTGLSTFADMVAEVAAALQ